MNVCTRKYQNKQKEWHHATKPLKKTWYSSAENKLY
jgi:hypothetical protein